LGMSKYDSLNPMQREAVYQTEGPLLILAGAGSGKTRVLTHRIAYLIEEKRINPWNILAITFTNKAAGEMKERVENLVGFGAESIWVATFHSTCVKILRRFADRLGYDTNFTIYDTDDQKTLIRQILKQMNLDTKMFKDKAILASISSAKDQMIMPEQMYRHAGGDYHARKEAEIYAEYQKALLENNAMDFDDLLMQTVRLFMEHKDVLEYYQNRFHYIMVDEYQDTNHVQFEFIRLLAARYSNLCVVGDDDQSIYKFRGANITNILSFEEHFPGARVIKLEQNYRSTMSILDAANEVICNNRGRKSKRLWSENGQGEDVHFRYYENGYEEAGGVTDTIKEMIRSGKFQYSDCAVLYRTNAQSRAFEEKCIAASIPYRLIGGVNFYQRQEIKDILAYLKTIDSGRDELSVRRIINVPKRGIGAATIEKIAQAASDQGLGFFQMMEQTDQIPGLGRAAGKVKSFVNQIMVFRAQAEYMEAAELIEEILETTGYLEELDELEEEKAQQKKENIEELINKAADFYAQREEPATLSDFLEEVALVADVDSLDQSANRLTLMTLHSAKGLEFPAVFLTGMEEGLFPSYMSMNSGDYTDLEEERRLCYVGITRAMKKLTISAAKMRTVRGETQYNRLSRFVEEIPADTLDWREENSYWKAESLSRAKSSAKKEEMPFRQTGWMDSDIFDLKPDLSELPWEQKPKKTAYSFSEFDGGRYGTRSVYSETPTKKVQSLDTNPGFGKVFSAGKAAALEYEKGDRVSHIKFGTGTVLEIVDAKKDYEVTVDFDKHGIKKMFAGFAKLKKI